MLKLLSSAIVGFIIAFTLLTGAMVVHNSLYKDRLETKASRK